MPMGDLRSLSRALVEATPPSAAPTPPPIKVAPPKPPGAPGERGENIYDRLRVYSAQLDPGTDLDQSVNFAVRSLCLDNDSSQWLFVPDVLRYIPPWHRGVVLPMPANQRVFVQWVAPKGISQPVTSLGSLAIYATEEALVPSPGEDIGAGLFDGSTWDVERTPSTFKVIKNVAVVAGTPVTIWTPATGKRFRVMGWTFGISITAGAVYLLDGATTFAVASCSETAPNEPTDAKNGYLSSAVNNLLKMDVSASASVFGTVWGTEE